MSKAKSPKHGLSFLISFQICRPKNPSSMIKSPLPAVSYMYSPVSSKTFDISFPSFPDPPPSTPLKITRLPTAFQSKSCTIQEISSELENESTSHAYSKPRNEEKMCNSRPSRDTDDETDLRISPSKIEKKKHKNARKKSISSGDSNETIYEEELRKKPLRQRSAKTRRFKRYGSKDWKEGGECHEKKLISGRLAPCMVNGKVNQSFVVVKRSVNPYEDFKKSMSEMIVEKQIFEPKELEQLLMCFLSLNSRLHQKVIAEAFTEVLKEVFCG